MHAIGAALLLSVLANLSSRVTPAPTGQELGATNPILDTSGRCDARTFSGASDRLHDRPVS
jgi:hypothetical protein